MRRRNRSFLRRKRIARGVGERRWCSAERVMCASGGESAREKGATLCLSCGQKRREGRRVPKWRVRRTEISSGLLRDFRVSWIPEPVDHDNCENNSSGKFHANRSPLFPDSSARRGLRPDPDPLITIYDSARSFRWRRRWCARWSALASPWDPTITRKDHLRRKMRDKIS